VLLINLFHLCKFHLLKQLGNHLELSELDWIFVASLATGTNVIIVTEVNMVRLVTKVSQIKVGQAQNFLLHNIHTQILVHQASYYTGTGRHFVTNKATEAYG